MRKRKLAAILAADVVGYSRLMAHDEAGTLTRLQAHRRQLIDPRVTEHCGRIVKLMGDGTLVEFASVVDAVQCATAIQLAMRQINAGHPEDQRMVFRIGIHLGDIIIEGDDIYGDGVNIAARLEGIAESGGISISEDAWRQVEGKVAANFVDTGEQSLKNMVRPVRVYRAELDAPIKARPSPTASAVPEKPSIAVLPFDNISGDLTQEFFADGLAEDIITTLSKLAGLRVIARNSSFVYKRRALDVREVAKQLGVRYVLEGSVRKAGDRIRITAQLIDAENGSHLWAERYDRVLSDIFAVQDEITLVLATEMQVKLTEGEQARLHYTTTSNVEAWTHWARGLSHYRQAVTKEKLGPARFHWERALALDPNSATLNAMLGIMHYVDARFGWWDDREIAIAKARAYAERAMALDPESPDACSTSSLVLLLEGRYEEAATYARRAVQLAAGSADAATFACFVLASSGYPEEAVAQIERAMTLSPSYPGYYLGHSGNAYRLSGRIQEAIAAFIAYDARSPGFGLADLVIIYQQTGQFELARRTAERLLAVRQDFTIASWARTQFRRDTAQLEADVAALRAAGIPMN
ncbi:MAG TPA: adenylate/guanylate cyclase domain-containing protein [Bradyrhizobium sp.]|nr:adenylate/guanylate cyclase domain-containing protein [Bradyrhizobium sp.]